MAIIVQTKKHRCVGNQQKITYVNPLEELTGTTSFSDVWYPWNYETDDLQAMEQYIEQNGIVIYQEEW